MNAATMKARFDEAENVWALPDMTLLNAGRRSPPTMPSALFGPVWPLLEAVAEGTATPVDYPAIAYLAACASLIGGKRRIKPYAQASWAEPCILWCGVVGDPSSRKSPALDVITDKLRDIERDHAEAHKANLRDYQEVAQRAKASLAEWEKQVTAATKDGHPTPRLPTDAIPPAEPARRRTLVIDTTPEAMGAILAGNPVGTLHFRDELAGWLESFNRYSPGGRSFWLEAFGGRSFVIDRKGASDPITIPFNGVSVLGGIQPAKMADALLSSPDDGLVARFLWAWPDKRPFTRPKSAADLSALENIYRRLESLQWGQDDEGRDRYITLKLTDDAADVFEGWQTDNAGVDDDASSLLKSFIGKQDGTVLRLALIAELTAWAANGGPEPRHVSAQSLVAAADWVDSYAKPMAERVYGDAALPVSERNAALLARYIRKQGMRTFNKRELRRSPHKSKLPALREKDALDAAVGLLVDAAWAMEAPSREGPGHGRQREDYIVNPAVFGGAA